MLNWFQSSYTQLQQDFDLFGITVGAPGLLICVSQFICFVVFFVFTLSCKNFLFGSSTEREGKLNKTADKESTSMKK